ncbi:MAG: ATP-binding protein, partial [Acidimicrobiales bacterium]
MGRATTFSALTSFVGRDHEQHEVAALLAASRIVTVVGPAGVGKTRFALEVAARVATDCRAGAWLVELAGVSDACDLYQATAAALGMATEPGRALPDMLVDRLRAQEVLLVLDNCEHLIPACASLVHELAHTCERVRVLATSRQRLGLVGERVWPLASLAVPPPGRPIPEESYDSVRLFAERAAAAWPGFALTDDVAPVVAEICRRLDGLPLAIELAAARVDVLSVTEICERLKDPLPLLRVEGRDTIGRHQSLESALAWGHELLSAAEAALFARLAVFVGGFALPAAEEVCSFDAHGDGPLGARPVFELLASLVAKSMVVTDHREPRNRYAMHETVRAFARERLAARGEERLVRARHADWFVEVAEQVDREFRPDTRAECRARLIDDDANLRAALRWSLSENPQTALRLAGALEQFWGRQGCVSDAPELLVRTLATRHAAPPALRARVLRRAASFRAELGDVAQAYAWLDEALSLNRSMSDDAGAARTLALLGHCRVMGGNPTGAIEILDEASALAHQAGQNWRVGEALYHAWVAHL